MAREVTMHKYYQSSFASASVHMPHLAVICPERAHSKLSIPFSFQHLAGSSYALYHQH